MEMPVKFIRASAVTLEKGRDGGDYSGLDAPKTI